MSDEGYKVISVDDDPKLLQEALDQISDDEGVVVSLVWQPGRQTNVRGETRSVSSGYVGVADYGLEESDSRH